MGDLIWAAALFVPLMAAVLGLLGPARRALGRWGDSLAATQAERDAKAALDLADAEEARHGLAVRRGALAEETAREKARLAAETVQFETDAQAARQCLPAAVEARRKALEARAEAEAELAPEAARKALEGAEDLTVLGEAYAEFCREYGYAQVPTFGEWIGNFRGLGQ